MPKEWRKTHTQNLPFLFLPPEPPLLLSAQQTLTGIVPNNSLGISKAVCTFAKKGQRPSNKLLKSIFSVTSGGRYDDKYMFQKAECVVIAQYYGIPNISLSTSDYMRIPILEISHINGLFHF